MSDGPISPAPPVTTTVFLLLVIRSITYMIWKPFRTRWQGCWAGPALSACPVANAKRCGTGVTITVGFFVAIQPRLHLIGAFFNDIPFALSGMPRGHNCTAGYNSQAHGAEPPQICTA